MRIQSSVTAALLIAASALTASSSSAATKRHPFTVEDLLAMERMSDAQLSPDGRQIAYTLRTTDFEANMGRTDVWLAATDGTPPRRLTSNPAQDNGARFSPDGKALFFLSTRSGSQQVWRIALAGGEAEQVTMLPVDVGTFVVVDDKRLVVSLEVYPDAPTLEDSVKREHEHSARKVKAQAYDELMFRHWDTWEDGKRSHLFVWEAGRAPVDLMKGDKVDAPTHPFGGPEELAISNDRKTLVFCAKDEGKQMAWSTNADLWSVPLDGSKHATRLTAANHAWDGNPVFSPDGKTLAYLAMARPGFESDRKRIVLMDWASRQTRMLTASWDRSPDEMAWSKDGGTLWVTADNVGQRALFRVAVGSGQATAVVEVGTVASPMPLADGGVAFMRNTLTQPNELYVRHGTNTAETTLTHHNDVRVAGIEWGTFEQFSFTGAHGDTVHGFLMLPAGHHGEKVPVAMLIHGGPQGSFGNEFHYRWQPEVYAGRGYAAVFIDFHGSTGYGQAFTDAIRGDWGGAPFEDLMKGLDDVLAKHAFLDAKHVVALGASYGGYMINWLNGHTDRFVALVCHDGNLDETMAYYDTDELWFPEWEHGGTPWEHPESYAKQSPLAFVKNWKTPTLVVHGGLDFRVVDTQGMSTFTALQRKGVPSRFLYLPDENHWVLKPQNAKRWHDEVLGWIDRWAKKK